MRDLAIQLCVVRAVDLAHAAGSEERDDFVGTEPRARSQRRKYRGCNRFQAEIRRWVRLSESWRLAGRGRSLLTARCQEGAAMVSISTTHKESTPWRTR